MTLLYLIFCFILPILVIVAAIRYVAINTRDFVSVGYVANVKTYTKNVNVFSASVVIVGLNNAQSFLDFEGDLNILNEVRKLKQKEVASIYMKKRLFSKPLAIEFIK